MSRNNFSVSESIWKLQFAILINLHFPFFRFARRALGIALYTARKESKRRGKRTTGYDAKTFLNDIKNDLGDDKFSSFLALQGDVTLMFALDVTGSMHDEIKASKEIIKKISQYDRSEPVDYILTTFSDPIGRLNSLFCFVLFCFVLFCFVLVWFPFPSIRFASLRFDLLYFVSFFHCYLITKYSNSIYLNG
jgi:hypothetical protein